jgi:predicted kinase
MTKRVEILRGIPGCGKSRYVRAKYPRVEGAITVSADDYFLKDGAYCFDPTKLPQAHAACLKRFTTYLVRRYDAVLIVDNTNSTIAEIAPYYQLAQAFGYPCTIVEFDGDVEVCAARNIHGVPLDVVQKIHDAMKKNDELLPPWWIRTKVTL